MVERERLLPPDAELSRPALVQAQRFVQRWHLYARQVDDGSYVCVHEQLNVGHRRVYGNKLIRRLPLKPKPSSHSSRD